MKKSALGFTLVELLVVIAIIAILAAIVVLIINPLELTRRGRDAARLSDLVNLQNAINVAVQEATASGTEGILCVTGSSGGINWFCTSRSDSGAATVRATDGTGWVRVNLGGQASVTVPTLPVDPINAGTNRYTYCASGDAWEITTDLESTQMTTGANNKEAADGGNDDARYEVGSNLNLITATGGNCPY